MHRSRERPAVAIGSKVDETGWVEVGDRGTWTVSSAKPGCGVQCLRDRSEQTFWQSDGTVMTVARLHGAGPLAHGTARRAALARSRSNRTGSRRNSTPW